MEESIRSLSVRNEDHGAGYRSVVYGWLACGWGPKAVIERVTVEQ